jgi:hypothetical protein
MIGFSDIVPTGCTSRRVAAGVFVQLLVLATRSEIRFKQQEKNTFADEMFFVMGNEDSSSSSSD